MSGARGRPLGSTYRLQLSGVGFAGAAGIVAYLDALGVETLYTSPVLAAAPGSTHGYDVIDPTRLDPELGTAAELESLLDRLDEHGMRLLIDIVPNHMAAAPDNRWWWDVLANGPGSEFASYFDIDWAAGHGQVLLPTLDAPIAEVLAAGRITTVDGGQVLRFGSERFPVGPDDAGPGGPGAVLGRQRYRLAFWRLERYEGNYRRFFDIDRLVGVRVEDPDVYEATHRKVLELVADRRVAGVRVDHVDGLADPATYLERLRADMEASRGEPAAVVVEKIFGDGEWFPARWAVDGATGYEFADLAIRLLVEPAGAAAIEALGRSVTSDSRSFAELAADGRRTVLEELFPGQLDRLAGLARAAIDDEEPGSDLALPDLHRAIGELTAGFDVYRTYLSGPPSREDRARIAGAARRARPRLGVEEQRALDALTRLLTRASRRRPGEVPLPARAELVLRWQQLSGAVAAKGVEDTACYRYGGLLAGAEVGGDPGRPSLGIADWHDAMRARRRRSPNGLNGLSTHDSKRSADVRARLAVISEIPEEWGRLVNGWRRRHRALIETNGGPDPHDELFAYQTLVGVWPAGDGPLTGVPARVRAAMSKAAREEKERTSWVDPDRLYERALDALVDALFADQRTGRELTRFVRRIGPAAVTNSLAMVALAATAPGVPDVYQGTERFDLSLMDPDNRRAVDFDGLAGRLAVLDGRGPGGPGGDPDDVKLALTAALLRLRRDSSELFSSGSYLPLEARGPKRDHVVAFARRRRRAWSITVVPRLPMTLAGGAAPIGARWGRTSIRLPDTAPRGLVDVVTGASLDASGSTLPVARVLSTVPVGVLVGR
ncbi:MAG: malto-oligosyltrehalose synthase [Acidimicrobiales bacterium]